MTNISKFILFWAAINTIAEKFSASTEDSEHFAQKLFLEYEKDGSPNDREKWLLNRLKDTFSYLTISPKWVGESAWAYYENEPMIFLHQFSIKSKDRSFIKKFPIGNTIYVFGTKSPLNPKQGESWRVIYRLLVQNYNGNTVVLSSYPDALG